MGEPRRQRTAADPAIPQGESVPCVVYLDGRQTNATRLVNELNQRGASTRLVDTCAGAVVELTRGVKILIVVRSAHPDNPKSSTDLVERLLATVERCFPHVQIWHYEAESHGRVGRLTRITSPQPSRRPVNGHATFPKPQSAKPAPPSSSIMESPSPLKPTDRSQNDTAVDSGTPDDERFVTREELEMLLGSVEGDDKSSTR
ncbi:MAG: hypothetical protein GC164_00435 [Phycisphaera sp.]|nr:hypothetical protein [Phycisphaera sp.]